MLRTTDSCYFSLALLLSFLDKLHSSLQKSSVPETKSIYKSEVGDLVVRKSSIKETKSKPKDRKIR